MCLQCSEGNPFVSSSYDHNVQKLKHLLATLIMFTMFMLLCLQIVIVIQYDKVTAKTCNCLCRLNNSPGCLVSFCLPIYHSCEAQGHSSTAQNHPCAPHKIILAHHKVIPANHTKPSLNTTKSSKSVKVILAHHKVIPVHHTK